VRKESERILIVGGDSLIGNALRVGLAKAGIPHDFTTRQRTGGGILFDLAAEPSGWSLSGNFTSAILCAARTRIAECQQYPDQTTSINVTRTVELAARLNQDGVFVCFLSTNLVFNGLSPSPKVDDPVCPVTEYGIQKAKAEVALRKACSSNLAIARLTKVVHPNLPVLRDWSACLRRNEPVYPFSDRVFSPLPLSFTTKALMLIAQTKAPGTYHFSADKDVSYAQLAEIIAQSINASPSLVQPVLSTEASTPFSALNCESTFHRLGLETPSANATLRELAASQS